MSYGPPPNQYGQGYNQPPQGYGSPYPPQQGGFPPQHGHGGPPPPQQFHQGGYPQHGPPQGYQNYGPPQGHQPPQGYGPPQGQYPQQQYGPPSMPSPGYDPNAQSHGDASRDADALRAAMKGFGTNETVLISILSKPDPLQMNLLRNTYNQRLRRDLEKDIHSETSGSFQDALEALVRGPLNQDAYCVHKAIKGIGTKESLLNDVLLGRSNADMRAIKQAYQHKYGHTMEKDVKDDLSMKTETLFDMVMSARRNEESAPIIHHEIDKDVTDLYQATLGKNVGTDQLTVCTIIAHRSDGQLRAINQAFQQKYHSTLEKTIEKNFSSHMEDALLLMVRRATDRAMTDALQLESAMAGAGTNNLLLVNRVVRIHWDRAHMDQVKRAYQFKFKRDLLERIRSEILSQQNYRNLMVACLT